jgi:hypothetical protein
MPAPSFPQNQLDRNARTTNDRFAVHDVPVHFDAFVSHGVLQYQGIVPKPVNEPPE